MDHYHGEGIAGSQLSSTEGRRRRAEGYAVETHRSGESLFYLPFCLALSWVGGGGFCTKDSKARAGEVKGGFRRFEKVQFRLMLHLSSGGGI